MLPEPETSVAPEVEPLTPSQFNAIIDQVRPVEVRLVEVTFNIRGPVASGPLMSTSRMHPAMLGALTKGVDDVCYAEVTQVFEFAIAAQDAALAASGTAAYAVRLELGITPPEAFWDMFLRRNVKLYTHPALRDLVASLCARSNLHATPLASVAVTQRVVS